MSDADWGKQKAWFLFVQDVSVIVMSFPAFGSSSIFHVFIILVYSNAFTADMSNK